jgi:hypothetical protein
VNDKDFNVDVSLDYIMEEYKEKSIPQTTNTIENTPIDINKEIINALSKLNDKELKILVYINQAILNFIIASDKTQDLIASNYANQTLFDIILN